MKVPDGFPMKVAKRRQAILELVLAGHTNVETLCRHLEVSEATVRRDLTALAEEGQILRTYGGATHIGTREPEPSLEQRSNQSGPEKALLARAALAHINDHDTLVLDGGTTTAALAKLLSERRGLHVITNNLLAVPLLRDLPEGHVTLLGGDLRPGSMSTFGPAAFTMLERLSADKVFLSADGVVAPRPLRGQYRAGLPQGIDDPAGRRGLRACRLDQARPRPPATLDAAQDRLDADYRCDGERRSGAVQAAGIGKGRSGFLSV